MIPSEEDFTYNLQRRFPLFARNPPPLNTPLSRILFLCGDLHPPVSTRDGAVKNSVDAVSVSQLGENDGHLSDDALCYLVIERLAA